MEGKPKIEDLIVITAYYTSEEQEKKLERCIDSDNSERIIYQKTFDSDSIELFKVKSHITKNKK